MSTIWSVLRPQQRMARTLTVLGLAAAGLVVSGCNEKEVKTPAAAPAQVAEAAPAKPASASAPSRSSAPAARPKPASQPKPAAKPVCADCATIEAVQAVEREGEAGGTGAVVGGLVGAALGNQVGQGQGKEVATVLGAIGGGIAGHQLEKKMKKTTVYQITLRMDDGQRRTMELNDAGALQAGTRVRVDGANLVALPAGQ